VVNSPLTTPEQAAQFLAVMRNNNKRKEFERSHPTTPTRPITPSRTPTGSEAFTWADGGVDSWFMQQRHRDKELRKRRQEAAQLLHGYKGYYPEKESDLDYGGWSPRNSMTPKGRKSFGEDWESATKKNRDKKRDKRRQTSFARLESNNVADEDDDRDDFLPNPLAPDRSEFLNVRNSYDGTGYIKPIDRSAYHDGHTLFTENGIHPANDDERDPGVTYTPFRYMNVETNESNNQLLEDNFIAGFENSTRNNSSKEFHPDAGDSDSLEALRQRRYDNFFQKTIETRDIADSRPSIPEGKVRERIEEERRRIKNSEAQMAEKLEKRFAEKGNDVATIPMSLSLSTEDSPPALPETIWRDFISDGKFQYPQDSG
jgi:hypothetical protein